MSINSLALLDEAASKALPNAVLAAARVLLASQSPVKAAFVARILNAVARLVAQMDERSVGNASAVSSDYTVLMELLEDPTVLGELRREDSLAPARLRGVQARQRLLEAEGGFITAAEAAALLHITRQGVDKRRRAGHLIGVKMGRRGYAYPAWQFDQSGTLPGLEGVLEDLAAFDPWMQTVFILNPSERLGGETPLAALRRGKAGEVRRAAQAYGEQGAE